MIVLDTSVVVDSFTGPRRSAPALRRALEQGERLAIPTLVLYEWRRGPRSLPELADQEALLPREAALAFGPAEATLAAQLYRTVTRPRGREVDLAIAACALIRQASFWTLNLADFSDIPGLQAGPPA